MTMTRRELLAVTCGAVAASLAPGTAATGSSASGASSGKRPRPGSVLTRPIPSSGESLPVIGLGTWRTFDVGRSPSERAPLEEVLREFVHLGGRVVDSSPMYGQAEEVVGELAARLGMRGKLFIATKVWTNGKTAGMRQMEQSEARLQARPLDLMQVHNLVDVDTHLDTLAKWKGSGRVRYVGITHYTAGALEEVMRVMRRRPLDFVQINYSVAEREAEKRLLPLAQELGIAVIANRPFASGDLFRVLRARAVPEWAAEIDCATWAQILLKFAVSHPAITCAIPATSKVTHLRDNMAGGHGRMPDAAMRRRIIAETAR